MIDMVRGLCITMDDQHVVVDVSGVGYGVEATASLVNDLELERECTLWIHTHVREDQITLFGFVDKVERKIFRILIGINRIGPKVAMGVLSTLTVDEIVQATMEEDAKTFARVPKIGTAQAKKLILELKPKLEKMPELAMRTVAKKAGAVKESSTNRTLDMRTQGDLQSALVNLGYKDKEAARVVTTLSTNPKSSDLPELIRLALRELGGGGLSSDGSQLESIF
jgi:Holliday junction DNA helicase RuvA